MPELEATRSHTGSRRGSEVTVRCEAPTGAEGSRKELTSVICPSASNLGFEGFIRLENPEAVLLSVLGGISESQDLQPSPVLKV